MHINKYTGEQISVLSATFAWIVAIALGVAVWWLGIAAVAKQSRILFVLLALLMFATVSGGYIYLYIEKANERRSKLMGTKGHYITTILMRYSRKYSQAQLQRVSNKLFRKPLQKIKQMNLNGEIEALFE